MQNRTRCLKRRDWSVRTQRTKHHVMMLTNQTRCRRYQQVLLICIPQICFRHEENYSRQIIRDLRPWLDRFQNLIRSSCHRNPTVIRPSLRYCAHELLVQTNDLKHNSFTRWTNHSLFISKLCCEAQAHVLLSIYSAWIQNRSRYNVMALESLASEVH